MAIAYPGGNVSGQLPTGNPFAMTGGTQYQSPYAGQATDPNQAPIVPGYNNTWNSSMAEAPMLAGMLNGVQYNTQPLNNLADYASNPNASPWAQASTNQSYQQQNEAAQNMTGQTAGATAGAEGALATQGGLSSGARDLAQIQGQKSDLSGQQGIAEQGMGNRSQIGINDASNKLQAQEALPGMETQAYQAQLEPIQMYGQAYGQDVANQMNSTQGLNNFNMGAYQTQGQMYGANQQAQAIKDAQANANATSGLFGMGGMLGTGLGGPNGFLNMGNAGNAGGAGLFGMGFL